VKISDYKVRITKCIFTTLSRFYDSSMDQQT